ncbi:NAD-dependent epimerase/dehydratase family protein [Geothrix terrae]|uniref:NAD-dependent epimerase/dehydratase family protein n=1 Tax=Geothrix terrae TaxID=2922720 RepID=UPI001FACF4AC|nr:NAD-dependent epimerase/dehydratase family protein [Geothrix terrae]
MKTEVSTSAGTHLLMGCGYTGARLARRLAARGPVLGLVRSEASAAALAAAGIPARALNLDRPGPFDPPGDLASVVYLAPPPSDGEGDPRLWRFLEALGPARPRALVYLSTTGVYGDTGGAAVDEAAPTAPGDARSRQRLQAEAQALRWCEAREARCVILRVAAIYGPHRLPLDRLRRGEPVLRAEDSGPGNRIHVDDLVAACLAALARPVAGVVNVADGCPEGMAAFTARVAALVGLPAPREVTWQEAQEALSPGLLAFLRESRRVLSPRLVRELGVTPRGPEAGIRDSLREMGLPASGG